MTLLASEGDGSFSFGIEFQKSLFRLMIEDKSFGNAMLPHIKPGYFSNEMLAIGFQTVLNYHQRYNALPTMDVLIEEGRSLESAIRPVYQATMEMVRQADLRSEEWIKTKVLEFVHRNIFVQGFKQVKTLFDRNQVQEAFAYTRKVMDLIESTKTEAPDRTFFFDDFQRRYMHRMNYDPQRDTISTGIPEVDEVLSGGLSLGELGVWLAYAKRGKSTMLVNQGAQAIRRSDEKVLHLVFEGSRAQTENRYDTFFAQTQYHLVKRSELNQETFQRLEHDYRMYQGKLVIRAFTEKWTYSVADIWSELQDLKRAHGFAPRLLVIDYGDLLRGSTLSGHARETEHQTAAFREMKTLAGKGNGFAIWTATQAQRPTTDIDVDKKVLQVRKIADAYSKVRVCDFMGSINQTLEERQARQARLFLEIYRENEASKLITVQADFGLMAFTTIRLNANKVIPTPVAGNPMGYRLEQGKAPF